MANNSKMATRAAAAAAAAWHCWNSYPLQGLHLRKLPASRYQAQMQSADISQYRSPLCRAVKTAKLRCQL